MTALNRKLMRDVWQLKGQALAICLVMACGVATFILSLTTLESMTRSQDTYYERYRFADIFAHLKRAPHTLATRLAEIHGVAEVQIRVIEDVILDVPGMIEPAVGRLISYPERGTPILNDLHLRSGRTIEPGQEGEVLVSEAFAEGHGFTPGSSVRAIINGRQKELKIVGIVLSPEYVIQVRAGDFWPDDKRFGVFWMGAKDLAKAFDMEGAFNDLSFALMPDSSEPEILAHVDRLTEPYGGRGAYGRNDQISHRYLTDEIKGLRGSAMIIPIIFLGVAAFLLNVVLSRLIRTQREEIAALKAFGYTKFEVGLHYLKLVLMIALVAACLGTIVGNWLGRGLTEMYAKFYRFPIFEFSQNFTVNSLGFLVSGIAAIFGALGAVRKAVKLPPAEAMRPEPPTKYQPSLVERCGLQDLFSQSTRMILRHLERQPIKALLSCLGIALATAILVLGSFNEDAIDYLMDFQFQEVQRQDMTVTFVEPIAKGSIHEIGNLPGVLNAEPFRSLAVRLRREHRSHRTGITGLATSTGLYRLLDDNSQNITLPANGLVLSSKLGELLNAELGDYLTVEVLEGSRPVRQVPVTGIITEFSGTSAYMDIRALNRLAQEGEEISGAFLSVDTSQADKLYTKLKTIPKVAGVAVKTAMLKSFQDTVAENLLRMRIFNVIFSCIIAFGVVYNSARISLSERSHELATLRVMGFHRAEISMILLGELAMLTAVAIPLGLILGYGFAGLVTLAYDTELYRIPLVIDRATYGFATISILVAAILSSLIVRRRLDHLDLIGVLKTRE